MTCRNSKKKLTLKTNQYLRTIMQMKIKIKNKKIKIKKERDTTTTSPKLKKKFDIFHHQAFCDIRRPFTENESY